MRQYEKTVMIELRINGKHQADMSADAFMSKMERNFGINKTLEEYIIMYNNDAIAQGFDSTASVLD